MKNFCEVLKADLQYAVSIVYMYENKNRSKMHMFDCILMAERIIEVSNS